MSAQVFDFCTAKRLKEELATIPETASQLQLACGGHSGVIEGTGSVVIGNMLFTYVSWNGRVGGVGGTA